jgi:AcrR family transcriptional regulator
MEDGVMDRDLLLEGARRAISLHGWRGATMERIAEEAGISRMTLHRRGISRQRILEGLAGRLEEEYRAAFWPALTASGSGGERLEAALRKQCEVTERNLAVLEALEARDREAVFHEGAGEEGGPVMTRGAFTGAYRRLLEDGAADGTLPAGDAGETASVLFNLVGLTYRHLRLGHRWEPEKAERAVVGVAMRGVVAR